MNQSFVVLTEKVLLQRKVCVASVCVSKRDRDETGWQLQTVHAKSSTNESARPIYQPLLSYRRYTVSGSENVTTGVLQENWNTKNMFAFKTVFPSHSLSTKENFIKLLSLSIKYTT